MSVGVFGVNYRLAASENREAVINFFCRLKEQQRLFRSSVLLITCNRAEIYFHIERDSCDLWQTEIYRQQQLSGIDIVWEEEYDSVLPRGYIYADLACFAHLFKVVAGCDSVILGETEIQGQVKRAYIQAIDNKEKLSSSLHFLFQKALKEGKRFRSEGVLTENPTTTEAVIFDLLADKPFDAKMLFVGYSTINCKIASFFKRHGRSNFIFCSDSVVAAENIIPRHRLSFFDDYEVVVFGTTVDFSATPYLLDGLFSLPGRVVVDVSVPGIVPEHQRLLGDGFFDMEFINNKIQAISLFKGVANQKILAEKYLDLSAQKHWNFFLERVSGHPVESYHLAYKDEVVSC